MNRKKLLKWFTLFFVAMFLLTFLSKAAASVSVARVKVSAIQNQLVTHKINGTGKIEGTREGAVFTLEGQRVGEVHIQEGQTVKKGDTLFRLSLETLEESIGKKKEEIMEITGKIEDLSSANAIAKEKKAKEQLRAQENYDTAVENGEINMANARMEVEVARKKLDNYLAMIQSYPGKADVVQEQALRDEARAREEALNQVIMTRNQEVREAERALEDSEEETPSDSSMEVNQTRLKGLKQELKKLKTLKKKQGIIKAPDDGVVKSVSVSTGSLTTEEAAVILYQAEGELKMTGVISKEEAEYAEKGLTVKIEGNSGTKEVTGVLLSLTEFEEGNEGRKITATVPNEGLVIGETVEFEVRKEGGPYPCCVPVSALYGGEGQEFVYVLDTEDSVLGEIEIVRKVSVKVEDKNETTVALSPGQLSSSQKVIIESDRELSEGSRVRLQES